MGTQLREWRRIISVNIYRKCVILMRKPAYTTHHVNIQSHGSPSAYRTLFIAAVLPHNQAFIIWVVFSAFLQVLRKKSLKKKGSFRVRIGKEDCGVWLVFNHLGQLGSWSKSASDTGREPYTRGWFPWYSTRWASFLVNPSILLCHVITCLPREWAIPFPFK